MIIDKKINLFFEKKLQITYKRKNKVKWRKKMAFMRFSGVKQQLDIFNSLQFLGFWVCCSSNAVGVMVVREKCVFVVVRRKNKKVGKTNWQT